MKGSELNSSIIWSGRNRWVDKRIVNLGCVDWEWNRAGLL